MKIGVDLFCGAGGTTVGAEKTGEVKVKFAVNHWDVAVQTHQKNFPDCKHVNSRLDQVNPGECDRVDVLFASPECTHHSRARGGRPTSDQQRSGAWDLMRWIEHHRPSWMVVENVSEFRDWGPVGANHRPMPSMRGKFFESWLAAIQSAGYSVDHRLLNAADFGAHTSRERLFVIARKGKRAPVWPEPTFTKKPAGAFPGMSLPKWRPAMDVIDWSLPCPSIFNRQRPLADKTLLRIEAGLRRFVGPFVAQWDNQSGRGAYCRGTDQPLHTLTTKASSGLVMPFQVILRNNQHSGGVNDPLGTICTSGAHHGIAFPYVVPNFGERDGQDPRTHDISDAMPTVTGHGAVNLCVPIVTEFNGGADRRNRLPSEPLGTLVAGATRFGLTVPLVMSGLGGGVARDVGKPAPTITAKCSHGLIFPFLMHYYGTNNMSPVGEPLDTITTRERHGLSVVYSGTGPRTLWDECLSHCFDAELRGELESSAMGKLLRTMHELGIYDVGFRMLQNRELSAAQGFPKEYYFAGCKHEVTRQIGNSVAPAVAEAITSAICAA